MAGDLLYLDSSAVAKLVIEEPESQALLSFIAPFHLISSTLTIVETTRAVFRSADSPEIRSRLAEVLGEVNLAPMDAKTVLTASRVHPFTLRSLDAIHLATAFLLDKSLAGFVAYDRRLAVAAGQMGFDVFHPGVAGL